MLFLLTNLLLFVCYYLLLTKQGIPGFLTKYLLANAFIVAQILLTQITLGLMQILYLPLLILLNVLIVIGLVFLNGPREWKKVSAALSRDYAQFCSTVRESFTGANIFLGFLFLVTTLWMVLAAQLLPPRGVDDLTYHLSPLYENIVTHRLNLLPIELRSHFAFPFNAELLFSWPIIFFHNVSPIGLVQYYFALIAVGSLYAIARLLNIPKAIAVFVSLQFLFAPVVLAQAGSAYVDIITSTLVLLSIFFAVKFYLCGERIFLLAAGITCGAMIGMKYSMFVPAAFLLAFIFPRIIKEKRYPDLSLYLGLIILLSAYWYIRNAVLFHSPVFPLNMGGETMGIFDGEGKLSFYKKLNEFILKGWRLGVKDAGLGSFHGGFGLTFWGIAFPSWIYVTLKGIFNIKKRGLFPLILWLQILPGFLLLFMVPLKQFELYPRFAIFVIGIGLLAMGQVLSEFAAKRAAYASAIKILCCIFCLFALIQLAKVSLPSYAVDVPIKDILSQQRFSKNRYLVLSSYMPWTDFAYEALDFISRDQKQGLICYYAAEAGVYWTAPIYGTRLQNRVWNFLDDRSKLPDAFLYEFKPTGEIFYLKEVIPLSQVVKNPQYKLVVHQPGVFLFLSKDALSRPGIAQKLIDFYAQHFPEMIHLFQSALSSLGPDIPIIVNTDAEWHALKYFSFTRGFNNPVFFSMPDIIRWRNAKDQNQHAVTVYSFGQPLENGSSREIFTRRSDGIELTIFENRVNIL